MHQKETPRALSRSDWFEDARGGQPVMGQAGGAVHHVVTQIGSGEGSGQVWFIPATAEPVQGLHQQAKGALAAACNPETAGEKKRRPGKGGAFYV